MSWGDVLVNLVAAVAQFVAAVRSARGEASRNEEIERVGEDGDKR